MFANVLRVRLVRINKTKIMIDKKQLIEELLECVNDATDTQTAITGMTMCAMLMNEVIDQALILPDGGLLTNKLYRNENSN